MRLSILLSVVLAIGLLMTPSAQAKVPKDFVGVQDDHLLVQDANYRTANLSSMSSLGVGTIRQPLLWHQIETSPGVMTFAAYDELVGKISAHGIKLLGVLFGPPTFRARTIKKGTCYPRKNSEFATYAAAVARR